MTGDPMDAFKLPKNLSAVILDMDGVVIDGMPYHLRAWKEAFSTVGIEVTNTDIYLREGMDQLETVKQIAGKKGVSLTGKEMEKIIDLKNQIFNSIFRTHFIPGSTEFIQRLKGLGFKLALVTGTNKDVVERILWEETALKGVFDVVVTAATAEHKKPDPEPYAKAVTLLKTDKDRCLVIENSPAGIASAKQAGLKCLALTTSLSEIYLREADCIFNSLEEVSALFD